MDNVNPSQITNIIAKAPVCGDCIGHQVGVPRAHVEYALERIAGTMKVATTVAQCDGCHQQTVVHRLG